ncbi:alpha/beta fold hydrolase [Halorubrum lipolyticum]|uniref:Alpha/beta hydrolase fold protein n=1 Tax=Halorubrum lipolyticum DSM 21995 TaxID=1227482 RepID=M0NJS2_9EURY|nr:alpha/beta hydrolase [Halorubrum lipolyticum]EMA57803.1 alpha/beta hydrolase fold protein [Halorubrum lipolyticum DSM 21995]
MKRVTHHGRDTAYRVSDRGGDGPTVCLVHGSGGSKDVWKAQARLSDRFPVVALDLSGHGDSDDIDGGDVAGDDSGGDGSDDSDDSTDGPAGTDALDAYADDVVAVAEATGATVLCGNSLGGAAALRVALARDLALDGLVLAGTGAKLAVAEPLRDALATDFDRAIDLLHEPDRLFHDAPPEYVELSRAGMRECGRAVTERDFRTCHAFDVRDRLGEIAVPSLAVVGEHDALTPVAYHDYLADRIDDCERAVIEDAAHLAMLERPTAFNAALAAFCSRISG